uniref:CX domain-containing protein n=1 Tax=Heligmosomoides polygyrus TaxID=6339 RepID=A0A183F4J0_HELPZ
LSASSTQEFFFSDDYSDTSEEHGRRLSCSWLPCCMDEEEADAFGHHVSIFMVALVAFATFFCVTLILVLVFLLG